MAISVGEPFGWAMSRVGIALLRPYAWRKWAIWGTALWLAEVHEMNVISGGPWMAFQYGVLPKLSLTGVLAYVADHMWRFAGWMMAAVVVLFFLYLLCRWVNCRGQFMMLEAITTNRLVLKESWARHQAMGNDLLWFKIKWDLAIFNLYLAVVVVCCALAWPDFKPMLSGLDYVASGWTWCAILSGLAGLLLVSLGVFLATIFYRYLLLPVMYVRNMRASEAFRHVRREMFWPRFKMCFLYLLAMSLAEMVHGSAATVAIILVSVATCGVGLILLYVPLLALVPLYLAMTLQLPVDIFLRAYSVYFVGQFGPEYEAAWAGVAPTGFEVVVKQGPTTT